MLSSASSCRFLGAPMARIAGAALARAVTDAGGLGFVGAGYGDPVWLDAELGGVDPSTVGVGIISWRLDEQPASSFSRRRRR